MSSTSVTDGDAVQWSPPGCVPPRAAFLVWGTPDKGPRSRVLAHELGISDMRFCFTGLARRRSTVPVRYVVQFIRTVWWLLATRPTALFVQDPPSIAAWIVAVYARLARIPYVIDAHSAMFQYKRWRWPSAIHGWTIRGATAVLVTDSHWARAIVEIGGNPMVVPDVPVVVNATHRDRRRAGFTVMVVNTWADDEPIDEIIAAAATLPEMTFLVTGRDGPVAKRFPAPPANVTFTGFLSHDAYDALLDDADAVICLTTREHTMQRGACEALSHARPIITSDHRLLRDHFADAAAFVGDTSGSIATGVRRVAEHKEAFIAAAERVRELRRKEWLERRSRLATLLFARRLPDAEEWRNTREAQ